MRLSPRPSKTPLVVLLVATLALGACSGGGGEAVPEEEPAEGTAARDSAQPPSGDEGAAAGRGVSVRRLLEAKEQDALQDLLPRLAEVAAVTQEPVENRHVPGQTDTLRTYRYDGLQLTVYDVSADEKALLRSLTVSSPAYDDLPTGLRVGMERRAVEDALGAPDERTGGAERYTYVLGDEPTPRPTLRVRFVDDTVSELAWSFYVD